MSDNAAQLIDAFVGLTPHERHAVIVELARISDADAGPVSNEELASAGYDIFTMYDDEESDRGQTESR